MAPDPSARLSAKEARDHPWLAGIEACWDVKSGRLIPKISGRTICRLLEANRTTSDLPMPSILGPTNEKVVRMSSLRAQTRFAPKPVAGGGMRRFAQTKLPRV
jgi:hypothetical protein